MKNLVFFASGSGTNFQSVIDAISTNKLSARITGLIASRAGIGAIDRAESHGIPWEVVSESSPDREEKKITELLQKWSPDLIILAGYLKKIPVSVISKYPNAIINIHPSLLPKFGGKGFYGLRVHQAIIDERETLSGCTVHYVTEEYDEGEVIEQVEVPVLPDDTAYSLADRVLKAEHRLLPEVIAKIVNKNAEPCH